MRNLQDPDQFGSGGYWPSVAPQSSHSVRYLFFATFSLCNRLCCIFPSSFCNSRAGHESRANDCRLSHSMFCYLGLYKKEPVNAVEERKSHTLVSRLGRVAAVRLVTQGDDATLSSIIRGHSDNGFGEEVLRADSLCRQRGRAKTSRKRRSGARR